MNLARIHLILILALLVIPAISGWFLLGHFDNNKLSSANKVQWPDALPDDGNKLNEVYAQLKKLQIWGVSAKNTTQATVKKTPVKNAPKGPPWRLVGISNHSGEQFALVEIRGNPSVQRVLPGNPILKGIKLISLTSEQIIIEQKGQEKTIALYQ